MDCPGGTKSARVCHAHDRNQDDSIENGWEGLDASKLDCNDKRRVTGRGTFASVQGAIGRDDQPNEEKVDNVEDGNTPYDLFRGPRDLLSWVGRLRSSQSCQLGASVGKCRGDEDTAEAMEAIEESGVG